ncbi:phage holin family protein [Bacillus tianshenii]|nr:phage holin family protein [Bacillus tianshenii]
MLEQMFQEITIHPQLVIVVPALMIIGYALKMTPFVKDWMIIWILLGCGVAASGLRLGFDVNGISNGIIAAGAAITTHQLFKQSIRKG